MISNSTSTDSTPTLLATTSSSSSRFSCNSLGSSHLSHPASSPIAHQLSNNDRNLTIVTSSGPNTLILDPFHGQLRAVLPFPFHLIHQEQGGPKESTSSQKAAYVESVGVGIGNGIGNGSDDIGQLVSSEGPRWIEAG